MKVTSWMVAGWFLAAGALAQDAAPEQPDYTPEEYAAYKKAADETDPAKKEEYLGEFLRAHPQSSLKSYILPLYADLLKHHESSKNYTALASSAERFLATGLDKTVALAFLVSASQGLNDAEKFITYGEQLFEAKPYGNLAYYLAKAFENKDPKKYFFYGEKAVEFMPEHYEMIAGLADRYALKRDFQKAARHARSAHRILEKMTGPPEGTDPAQWRSQVALAKAHWFEISAGGYYQAKQHEAALQDYDKSLAFYKRNDAVFYFRGICLEHLGRLGLAMDSLAKSMLLKGPSSQSAKQRLEYIYRSLHNQTLVGMEAIIAKAQADLDRE